jgi:hypothetical protein
MRRKWLPWALAFVASLAVVFTLIAVRSRHPGPALERARAAWAVAGGAVAADGPGSAGRAATTKTALLPGGTYRAVGEAEITSPGGLAVRLRAGTRFRLEPGAALPTVLSGEADVETAEPLRLGVLEIAPIELSRLVFDSEGFTIASGRIEAGGRLLESGERFDFAAGPAEPPVAPEAPAGEPALALARAGRVISAATDHPIAGAVVRATAFHGTPAPSPPSGDLEREGPGFDAAADLAAAATWPPLHVEQVATADDGSFALTRFAPDDPRISIHLQVEHPGHGPETAILADRWADGRWPEVEVRLRPAMTVRLEVAFSDGTPLAEAPLRVAAWGEGYDFLEAGPVELGWNGALLRRGPDRVLWTDEKGALHLPFTGHPFDLDCLHPAYYLYHRDLFFEMVGVLTLTPRLREPFRAEARTGAIQRRQVLLRPHVAGPATAAAGTEVEVAFAHLRPRRLRTDEGGWFEIGIEPLPENVPAPTLSEPLPGRLTILAPELPGAGAPVFVPSVEEQVAVHATLPGRIAFRAVDEETLEPVPPERIHIFPDLTVLRRGVDGRVECRGVLPPTGSAIEVSISGRLPWRGLLPGTAGGDIDLGDVPFARGWEREAVLADVPAEVLPGAALLVRDESVTPPGESRYPLGGDGRVLLTGLHRGSFTFALEGPLASAFAGSFSMLESDLVEPLVLEFPIVSAEEVAVHGRVVDLEPLDAAAALVIERFLIAGAPEPVAFPPYPLAPDGSFGSVRRLAGVLAAEVTVLGSAEFGALVVVERGGGPPVFAAGEVRLGPRTHAEVSFVSEGLRRVTPPFVIRLRGEEGAERLARLRVRKRNLFIDGLLPGTYSLLWHGPQNQEETHAIEAPRGGPLRIASTATRSALAEEIVEVLVTDAGGQPIPGARVVPPAPPNPHLAPEEPGVLLARAFPLGRTSFVIEAPGFLTAHLEVEPRTPIPSHVILYRPAAATALLLDAAGERFTGDVAVSWEPLAPGPITYGAPLAVAVTNGVFETGGLPAVPLRFTLAPGQAAGVSIRREWTFAEGENQELGILRFAESRRLSGRVVFPDGTPAAGAAVALVPRGDARRFPYRPHPLERARFSVKADALGEYALEGLPVEPLGDLVLGAYLPGWASAREDPVDFGLETHDFVCEPEAVLELDAGYDEHAPESVRSAYAFTLDYLPPGVTPDGRFIEEGAISLGEVAPPGPDTEVFAGIEPGTYRLRWGLRKAYPRLPGTAVEAFVPPGEARLITLRAGGRVLGGSVTLNGTRLDRGWVILTADPASGVASVGRVREGKLVLADPPEDTRAYVAVIPERTPQPLQNTARGEALPVLLRDYRGDLRDGSLRADYRAHDLTVRFTGDFLARHPRAYLVAEHYEWERGRFRGFDAEEAITGSEVTFHLLPPGPRSVSVRSERGSLVVQYRIDLQEDSVLEVR